MSMIHSLVVDPLVVGKLCDLGKSCNAMAPELKVGLSISISAQERHELITKLACTTSSPSVSTETNHYRQRPGSEARHCFRQCLLGGLRAAWKDKDTEAHFLRLVDLLDRDGCIVFAGLLNVSNFQILIDEFTIAMSVSGRGAFLHSYVNLADYAAFLKDSRFNTAFAHPLLLALMAYAMGGPLG
ncbi:hypothetical protein EsDP_00006590 [Epichloe bromicola]|uniref:Uncharacterized protein n=1 Tax=Epichloe bromicola TaxID=79588 RepID=A0ABQ0CY50_9HYPO